MKTEAIGGYFELELHRGSEFHADAIALNSARNCLEYILLARKYKKVYIPGFTCEVVLEPFHKHNVDYEFYSINELLEPACYPKLSTNEAFLYTNYFGLKQKTVEKIASLYGEQTIIDNAQAFYAPPLPGIDTFYSPRKFFGVPDGGYLYTNAEPILNLPQDSSWMRMQHLLRRIDEGAEAGYADFRTNSKTLVNAPMKRMSKLTHAILCSIDYETAKQRRLENYRTLAERLSDRNALHLCASDENVPLVFPYLTPDISLRTRFISLRIFVATYWPNVIAWNEQNSLENKFVEQLLPLPVDQRYDKTDMLSIVRLALDR